MPRLSLGERCSPSPLASVEDALGRSRCAPAADMVGKDRSSAGAIVGGEGHRGSRSDTRDTPRRHIPLLVPQACLDSVMASVKGRGYRDFGTARDLRQLHIRVAHEVGAKADQAASATGVSLARLVEFALSKLELDPHGVPIDWPITGRTEELDLKSA